ncbi:MAG TPA: hypothetical protein VNQ31_08370 [Sphingomonadaceae bacterium]|jgi:hypothetical protein|nr:hypothetical protein [Sphingomonadaceae bacterium]
MDRIERRALAVAVAGHVALFGVLSLGLVSTAKLPPLDSEPIDVQFVDAIGLRSAATEAAVEPPAESEAPDVAKPEDAAPPEPTPAPPEPKPEPPRPAAKVAPPEPAKPAEAKEPRRRPDRETAPPKAAPAKPAKPAGTRLGPDFLKGITPEKTGGRGQTPRAATVGAQAMAGLAAAIKRQIQPCYELGALQGTPAMEIVTVLDLRFNKDGSVAGDPAVAEQTGVNAANQAYRRQIAEVARRAVLRCAPLRLPAELYEGGWSNIQFVFTPGTMR